jgi:hypothetical protein
MVMVRLALGSLSESKAIPELYNNSRKRLPNVILAGP